MATRMSSNTAAQQSSFVDDSQKILSLYEHFIKAAAVMPLPEVEAIARKARDDATVIQSLVFAYLALNDFDNVLRLLVEIDERKLEHSMLLDKLTAVSAAIGLPGAHAQPPQPTRAVTQSMVAALKRFENSKAETSSRCSSSDTVGPEDPEDEAAPLPSIDTIRKQIRRNMEKKDIAFVFHRIIRELLRYFQRDSPMPSEDVYRHTIHLLIVMKKEYNVIPLDSTFFIMIERAPTTELLVEVMRVMQSVNIFNPRLATVCGKTLERLGHLHEAQAFIDSLTVWTDEQQMLPKARASKSAIAIVRNSSAANTMLLSPAMLARRIGNAC